MPKKLWTQSRGRARRRCAMLEHRKYVQGWRPKESPDPAYFGTCFHWGMEGWWNPKHQGDEKLAKALERVAGTARSDVEQIRLEVILTAYHERWIGDVTNWKILGIEETFVAPLRNPETGRMSQTWELGGKMDVVAQYIHNQRNYVVEHKTTSDDLGDETDYWLKLMMDPQASQYYVGADYTGYDVYGILYDVVVKTRHKPGRVNPKARRRKDESDESWAERSRMETLDEFRTRLLEHYRENLHKLIQRKPIARTHEELADFLKDAWHDAQAAHQAHRNEVHPRNPDACNDYHRLCEYFGSCALGEQLEQDERFEQTDWVHPELKEEAVNDARDENERD